MAMALTSNTNSLFKVFCKSVTTNVLLRALSTRVPETVLIEKNLEDPVLVLAEEDNIDLIGPPDSISNLRPILRKRLINETVSQQKLREFQDTTQTWNQIFWENHNTKFLKEKEDYINSHQVEGEERRQLNADEMSEFYKKFLDENWETHIRYNAEWYKKNFTMLFLALRVNLEKNLSRIL